MVFLSHFSLCPQELFKKKILGDPGLLRTYLTEIHFKKNDLPQGWGQLLLDSFLTASLQVGSQSTHAAANRWKEAALWS